MIRTDKAHQWASTQMAMHEVEPYGRETPDDTMLPRKNRLPVAKWPLEDNRYPEAAHSAIDWDDDDTRAIPGAGPIVWLVWGVCASIIAYVSWDFVAGFVHAWGRL